MMVSAAEFAGKVRRQETVVGYWIQLDSPTSTEHLAAAHRQRSALSSP